MSDKTPAQRAAREAQKRLNCSYPYALSIARSQEMTEVASKDTSERPFRVKLTDAVIAKIQKDSESEYIEVWSK